jgi:hypothetical protein
MERSTFWLILLSCVAVVSAATWLVGTGTLSERVIAMNVGRAASEPTAEEILSRLADARSALDKDEAWLERFSFLVRTQQRGNLERTRRIVSALEQNARELSQQEGSDPRGIGIEALRDTLRNTGPLYTDAFLPEHRTAWGIAFWLSAVPALMLGLVRFIRRM